MRLVEKRVWADVSLAALTNNFNIIKNRLAGVGVMAVVKADAYGHGAVETARHLEKLGANYLAVADLNEAVELRDAGLTLPLLIFGYTHPRFTGELLARDITQTVFDARAALEFSREAQRLGARLRVHIKLDTGMTRLGVQCFDGPGDACLTVSDMASLPGLHAEGIFTHLASSEIPEDPGTLFQIRLFEDILANLRENGKKLAIRHCANSGGVVNYTCSHMDMARPGILLYGAYSGGGLEGLVPAMSIRAVVAQVKEVPAGRAVSYNGTYVTERASKIAVIAAGYADGYPRPLSRRADVLLRGVRAKVLGNVCMDMFMADVTHIPDVRPGDYATLLGGDGDELIGAHELAELSGTIPYEILCGASRRVLRVYHGGSGG